MLPLLVTGCLSDPPGPQLADMCEVTSDCDSGEVCDDGICWGSPPSSQFAFVLTPQSASATAAQTELMGLSISQDGTIDGLSFSRPVAVRGKVTLKCGGPADGEIVPCGSDVPIRASIRVEREASFTGGPRLVQTFQTETDNLGPGEHSFELLLPATELGPDEEPLRPYHISIVPLPPEGNTPAAMTPSEIAPPLRLPPFAITEDTEVEWIVGDPAKLHWVSSCIAGPAQDVVPYTDLAVAAFEIDSRTGEEIRISALSRTDSQGCFSLRVPNDRETLTIRIQPTDGRPSPTVELRGEAIPADYTPAPPDACFAGSPDGAFCLEAITGPPLPVAQRVSVPVAGPAGAGGSEPVSGAKVTFFAPLDVPPGQRSGSLTAFLAVDVTTGANPESGDLGTASADLRLGIVYQVSVQPAAGERFASSFNQPLTFSQGGVQEPIVLGERLAVTGTLLNWAGEPIESAVVVANASLGFRINYPQIDPSIVDALRTTTTTSASGTFVLYLERDVAGGAVVPTFDIEVQPGFFSEAPHWTLVDKGGSNVSGTAEDLGQITLPRAAFVRGHVADADGDPVAAEVRIFEITGDDVCTQSGQQCAPRVLSRGSWLSDESTGFLVKAVLPRP